MSDLIEFRHLKYIVAVAEEANFSRAAERLFQTQPSLSRQIRDIEEDIGFPIFTRTRHGVTITPAGAMVVAYAQEALSSKAELLTLALAVHRKQIPIFRMGFSSFIKPRILEEFHSSYTQLFTNCELQLSGGDPIGLLQQLKRKILDGVIIPMPADSPEYVVHHLVSDPLVACMRVHDPLAHDSEVSLAAIAKHLHIFRSPDIHPAAHLKLVELLAGVGIEPVVTCSGSTPLDIQWLVRAGRGIAIIDQTTTLETGLTTRPIAGIQWTADTAFVHHREANHLSLPFVVKLLREASTNNHVQKAKRFTESLPTQLELLA